MKSHELNEFSTQPIPGPKERIRCKGCGKPRTPWIWRESKEFASTEKQRQKILSWRYSGYGHFCTMRCATRFANRVIDESQK